MKKPTVLASALLVIPAALLPAPGLFAQQSSTNNNDLSYTTLGRRSTSINQDSGSQPHIGAPPLSNRQNGDATNAGSGFDTGPFGSSHVVDGDFVTAAGMAALVEVELGKVVIQKSQDEATRKYAEKVVDANTKMRNALQKIASEHNMKIPMQLDAKHKSRIEDVAKLSGPAFDRAYLRHVASYYERSLGRFDFEANNGNIPELAMWANRVMPRIRQQLKAVKADLRAMPAAPTASNSKKTR